MISVAIVRGSSNCRCCMLAGIVLLFFSIMYLFDAICVFCGSADVQPSLSAVLSLSGLLCLCTMFYVHMCYFWLLLGLISVAVGFYVLCFTATLYVVYWLHFWFYTALFALSSFFDGFFIRCLLLPFVSNRSYCWDSILWFCHQLLTELSSICWLLLMPSPVSLSPTFMMFEKLSPVPLLYCYSVYSFSLLGVITKCNYALLLLLRRLLAFPTTFVFLICRVIACSYVIVY